MVVYLLAGIWKLKESLPMAVVSVQVDDISIARLSRDRQVVVDEMTSARNIMNKEFIQVRALSVASKKMVILVTDGKLVAELAKLANRPRARYRLVCWEWTMLTAGTAVRDWQ
jgi:hypothetical protein